jgi:catechol 2,3-dioxygenase-like lactoylglutathione lyase family enzyme
VKLNHLDLQVTDVPSLTTFLVDHFDLQPLTRLDSPRLAILTDGHGFTLVIQRRKHDGEAYPEGAHIGFLVDDPAEVHTRRARLAAAGVAISEVATTARGSSCYCRGPGEILIEVGCNAGSRVAVASGPPSHPAR